MSSIEKTGVSSIVSSGSGDGGGHQDQNKRKKKKGESNPKGKGKKSAAATSAKDQRVYNEIGQRERLRIFILLCLTWIFLKGSIAIRITLSLPFSAQREKAAAEKRSEENRAISQLDSTREFAKFLSRRKNYEVPEFLGEVLGSQRVIAAEADG